MQSKKWHKPELIVLVRSNSEELVLTHCKTESGGSSSLAQDTYHGCSNINTPDTSPSCGTNCQSRGGGGS